MEQSQYISDLSNANKAIINSVIPVLHYLSIMEKSKFICLECLGEQSVIDFFDQQCGFDWFCQTDEGLVGVAARCRQGTGRHYRDFTIRNRRSSCQKTELEKRLTSIRCNTIFPTWTFQAYLKGDWNSSLDYMALIRTEDLYDNLSYVCGPEIKNSDGTSFYAASWQKIIDKGIKIYVYEGSTESWTVFN